MSLWETLTKEPLFDGHRPRQVRRQIRRQLAAKLVHERVHADVREILRRALAIEPCERYPSMQALVADLEHVTVPSLATEPCSQYRFDLLLGQRPRVSVGVQCAALSLNEQHTSAFHVGASGPVHLQWRDRVCPTRSMIGSPLVSRKTSSQRSGVMVAKVERTAERMIASFISRP